MKKHQTARPCAELRNEFNPETVLDSRILKFNGFEDHDIYNPSVPFVCEGKRIIACRVETRSSEDSFVAFFAETPAGEWTLIEDAPVLRLQDPCVTFIGNEIVLGGVRLVWENERIVSWVTDFYRGASIYDLVKFTEGPSHMKDIRMIALPDGRIAVFSRPQGEKMMNRFGCIARIGFDIADSLEDVTPEFIENAPLLAGHFTDDEWGGCNSLHILENGLIGVLGHISRRPNGDEHLEYNAMTFAIDPDTRHMTRCKIIAVRESFPAGEYKWPRIKNVLFSSGLHRHSDGTATLYSGLSDCQIGMARLKDPFVEYEQIKRGGSCETKSVHAEFCTAAGGVCR